MIQYYYYVLLMIKIASKIILKNLNDNSIYLKLTSTKGLHNYLVQSQILPIRGIF